MSSTQTFQHAAVEDPDAGWKPSNRPQSTIARNFMSELDDLFRLDGGIDLLDKTVHQKKQAVSTHTEELQALEAKLRETEERLNQARNSPPRRTPVDDKARQQSSGSPQPMRHNKENAAPRTAQNLPDRPRTARTDDGQKP